MEPVERVLERARDRSVVERTAPEQAIRPIGLLDQTAGGLARGAYSSSWWRSKRVVRAPASRALSSASWSAARLRDGAATEPPIPTIWSSRAISGRSLARLGSGVSADEQDGGDRERERAVADEERGPRPGRERMGAVSEGEDLPP